MSQLYDVQVRKGLVAPNTSIVDQKGSQDGVGYVDGVHGDYYAASLAGRLFYASNQAAVATTAALATTWTGLGIANPSASGKNLVLREFTWGLSVVGPDEGVIGLMSTTNSGFAAAITPECTKYGAGASVAYVDDGATIATPILVKVFSTYGTGAITTWQGAGFQGAKLDGQIIIPPGRAICTYTTTATTAALVFSFLWEEVDA